MNALILLRSQLTLSGILVKWSFSLMLSEFPVFDIQYLHLYIWIWLHCDIAIYLELFHFVDVPMSLIRLGKLLTIMLWNTFLVSTVTFRFVLYVYVNVLNTVPGSYDPVFTVYFSLFFDSFKFTHSCTGSYLLLIPVVK